jgi:hypothetical protein
MERSIDQSMASGLNRAPTAAQMVAIAQNGQDLPQFVGARFKRQGTIGRAGRARSGFYAALIIDA